MSAPTTNGKAVDVLAEEVRAVIAETAVVPSENKLMEEHSISRPKAKQVRARALTSTVKVPAKRAPKRAPAAPDVVRDRAPVQEPSTPVEVVVAPEPETRSAAGRWHAWAGFLFGTIASLAANVAHAQQHIGAQLVAAFAPLALLVVVEVSARVQWAPGVRFVLARWLGVGAVAVIAFTVSYRAQAALFVTYGFDDLSAAILPIAVDGLMLVCGAALLSIGGRRTR